MFEIDSVQRAIEHHRSYEVVDKISDTYFDLIELATRPRLTDANVASIARRRQFLQANQDFTTGLLERNQWLSELAGTDVSLLEAYLGTLAQVDELVKVAGR